jgi:hypothetical protein
MTISLKQSIRDDDAMGNWVTALASAPHVLQGAWLDDPSSIRALADSSASLHGLVQYVRENHAVLDAERALLDWDLDLLAGACTFLYRNLGLSEDDTLERMGRLSGAMQGTARYMDTDPLATWAQVRNKAEQARAIAA